MWKRLFGRGGKGGASGVPAAVRAAMEDVDWSLHHAYGPATDVPDLVQALIDPARASEAIRKAAAKSQRTVFGQVTYELWGNVFHQGSVWQVTPYTVPVFAAIALDRALALEARRFALDYLHHLAVGYPRFPERVDPEARFVAADGLEDDGGPPDYAESRWAVVWARDTYLTVELAIERLAALVADPDAAIAGHAAALASAFPRCAPTTLPALRAVADASAGPALVARALLADPEVAAAATAQLGAPDRLTALYAAIALAVAEAAAVTPDVAAILCAPLDALAERPSPVADTVGGLVAAVLPLLPASAVDAATTARALRRLV